MWIVKDGKNTKSLNMNARNKLKTLIIGHLIAIFLMLSFASNSYAWFSVTGVESIQSTHDAIGKRAVQLVGSRISNQFLKDNMDLIMSYTYHADHDKSAHGENNFRNGGDISAYYEKFLIEYKVNDFNEAAKYLGYCIHLIQDMNVPAHAFNIPHYNPVLLLGKEVPDDVDNFELSAFSYQSFTIKENEISDPLKPNIAFYCYDTARKDTQNNVKYWGFSDYWIAGDGDDWCGEYGLSGCDDGPQGHYNYDDGDKFNPNATISSTSFFYDIFFIQNQLNQAVKYTGMFLLGIDRILSVQLTDDDVDDIYEDNDSSGSAAEILTPFDNNALQCNDDDWFKVWVQQGAKLAIGINFSHAAGDLDLYLYSSTGNLLQPSESASDTETITFGPSSTNDYYYIVVHGCNGAKNSYGMHEVIYTTDSPDLTAQKFNFPSSVVTEGDSFWISTYIYNSGKTLAGASHASLYLSTNNAYNTSGAYLVGDVSVSPLDPLTGEWVSWSFSMPNLGSASYNVWGKFIADSWGEVNEGSENNTFVGHSPFVAYDSLMLTGLSIIGPDSSMENSSASYVATAWWSNGTTTTVIPTWGENSAYSAISTSGVLTTLAVSGDQSTTITASYAYGGVTKTATKTVTILNITAVPSSLTIYGPSSVNENSQAGYIATATWSDGTITIVSPTWSENSSFAAINGSGALTTSAVTSDQSATITANYTFNGVTKSATKSVKIADVPATLTGLSITGAASVNENSTATYTATASWDDGSTSTVTPSWSVNPPAYASISAGVLTTTEVPSNQTATITASYTSGGDNKNCDKVRGDSQCDCNLDRPERQRCCVR